MKQAKLLLLSLLVVAMLFTYGCNHTNEPKEGLASTSVSATQAPETKEPAATPAESDPAEKLTCTYEIPDESFISLDYAKDELVKKYKAYEEFDESEDSENQVKVMFRIGSEVKNVRFLEIFYEEDAERVDTNFVVNRVLCSKDELLPEKPFVIGTVFHGTLPTRAISFVDENNKTRYFSLEMSGLDSSLFFLELVPRDDV